MRRTITTLFATLALLATGVVAGLAAGGTGTVDPPPKIAFLANGIVPADALAAGGIAGQLGAPLFTTPAGSLNGDAAAGIDAYDPDLVIVLGGPVAITDDVVAALATATGLAVTTADAPTDGIVRVAGGDRFATARAVAALLAAYDPAYLPVDATALGAVDADTAGVADTANRATTAENADDSDLLDGLDSAAFQPAGDYALADTSCAAGQVVTGIATDGTPTCAPDTIDGGDADTLDGLDSADFLEIVGYGSLEFFGTETLRLTEGLTLSRPFNGVYCFGLPGDLGMTDVQIAVTTDWAESDVGVDDEGLAMSDSAFCPATAIGVRTFDLQKDADNDVSTRVAANNVGFSFIIHRRAPIVGPVPPTGRSTADTSKG